MSNPYDIEFFWDPVCPFAWITSRWVAKVSAQTGYKVDWRFIALRLLNKHKNYATEFPPEYEHGHTAGLRMLRVAARVRAELGREQMGPLYEGYGKAYWDQEKGSACQPRDSTKICLRKVLWRSRAPSHPPENCASFANSTRLWACTAPC
jgi:hypothetical protein